MRELLIFRGTASWGVVCAPLVLIGLLVSDANGAEKAGKATKPAKAEKASKVAKANVEANPEGEPFRPEVGQFPPLDKAYAYRGELVFVDHANRRGSLRVQSNGTFFRNSPHPFAMLPYGVVRYHGAPADLRDIPLGTVVRVQAFLPPDPEHSAVPVLPVNNREFGKGYQGTGTEPAENHVLLLEDEPSHALRVGKVWKLQQIEVKGDGGTIVAKFQPKGSVAEDVPEESMTFDAATRVWRGKECIGVDELIAEGVWPTEGKRSLDGQEVLLGITWKPTPGGVFTRFHLSDIWMDDVSLARAARRQGELHKAFIRSRWMPAWVDAVEYGKFGRATVTATLFGGMDPSLYADFKAGDQAVMNASENTLKHIGGSYGPAHMASKGPILEVTRFSEAPPLGSSGIRIRFETDLIIEGIRTGRVVRVRPGVWPELNIPREEYLGDGTFGVDARFPTPAIFPKY